jgi:hypothetical protein
MNDTPKHTPGPWEYRGKPEIGYIVFRTWDTPTAGYVHTEGDARLIAAAPDMLEALKLAYQVIDELDHVSFRLYDLSLHIKDAVIKAEGVQQ